MSLVEPDGVIRVSLGELSPSELAAVAKLLRELKRELQLSWPVEDIRLTKRNPHVLHAVVFLAVSLTTGFVTGIGAKLSTKAFDWVWKRLNAAPTKKKQKRTRK